MTLAAAVALAAGMWAAMMYACSENRTFNRPSRVSGDGYQPTKGER